MWLFEKKVLQDDFIKLKTNVKQSSRKHKKDFKLLNQKRKFLERELNKVKLLSKQFSELQDQLNRKDNINSENKLKIKIQRTQNPILILSHN